MKIVIGKDKKTVIVSRQSDVLTAKSTTVITEQDKIAEMRRFEQDRILFWGS